MNSTTTYDPFAPENQWIERLLSQALATRARYGTAHLLDIDAFRAERRAAADGVAR